MSTPDMDEDVAGIIAAAEHPTLKRIVALWDEKRAGRRWPSRADFDPIQMKYALGDLSLYDVEDDPRRYRCRLDGTRQVDLFGVDCTGRYLDESFPPEYYALAHRSFTRAVDEGRPLYFQRQVPYAGRLIHYEVVMLPQSSDGRQVDQLMVALTPHWD
ncbi:PAS domain-containing protein [Dongia sp.]|uniref:PAS domain-containing protein n=1 Tax=Dongia sp. TaxID=1977262 RepID=UPI0035B0CCA1